MQKKVATIGLRLLLNKAWRCPTLTWGDPTLPSALSVFTSEFEKGSGGSHSLLPPGKLVWESGSEPFVTGLCKNRFPSEKWL